PVLEGKPENAILQIGGFIVYKAQVVSIFIIVFLTWVNTLGINGGKWIQRIFTITKLLSLFGLLVLGFLIGTKAGVWKANWFDGWNMHKLIPSKDGASI